MNKRYSLHFLILCVSAFLMVSVVAAVPFKGQAADDSALRQLRQATDSRVSDAVAFTVDASAEGEPISPYLLGSNLPNWLSAEQFTDEVFLRRVAASGLRLLRIPGGSFSNEYGWLSCELGEDVPGAYPCSRTWVRRPTEFINFFRALGRYGAYVEPMFIVNVNVTAQEAAAAVAFFNSPLGDTTPIGIDRNGTDWKTAGDWAALRAENGNPEPLHIPFWEIGNEVYGGRVGNPGCFDDGWEITWTCLASEYILGTAQHDGFIQMRAAMLQVDPTIQVGAVGGTDAVLSSSWSREVLQNGASVIDYFVIHSYPVYALQGNPSREIENIFRIAQYYWQNLMANVDDAYDLYADGRDIPLVVNEYSIVPPFGQADTRNYMNLHVNALFIADSLGQMMTHGMDMAANWSLMNDRSDQAEPITIDITVEGVTTIQGGWADTLAADTPDSETIRYNGMSDPADDLSDAPASPIAARDDNVLSYTCEPFSVTLLRINATRRE